MTIITLVAAKKKELQLNRKKKILKENIKYQEKNEKK